MTATRIAMFVAGGALLTAWLVGASTARKGTGAQGLQAPTQATGADPLSPDLPGQTRRLRAAIEAAPAPRVTDRNPFAFAPAPRSERGETASPSARSPLPLPPLVAPPPVLRLVGIAADGDTRTAAIAATGRVALVRVGDAVAGRYRVTAITADVVELSDEMGGPVLRLGLR